MSDIAPDDEPEDRPATELVEDAERLKMDDPGDPEDPA
jgi:hypothetical protein